MKQFFENLELHIRGLEAQNKKKEKFEDLLTLLLMDKLSGDLRRCLDRDHRKTTWTIDDFLTALKRELQVMEQYKTKERNSMTKLQPIRLQPFTPTKHKIQENNTKLDTEPRTTEEKKTNSGVIFLWIITSRRRLPKTHQR